MHERRTPLSKDERELARLAEVLDGQVKAFRERLDHAAAEIPRRIEAFRKSLAA